MRCASVYKVSILNQHVLTIKMFPVSSPLLSSPLVPLSPRMHAELKPESWCPWASNRRSLPEKIKPIELVLNIVFFYLFFLFFLPSNEPCMQGKSEKKKRQQPRNKQETTF